MSKEIKTFLWPLAGSQSLGTEPPIPTVNGRTWGTVYKESGGCPPGGHIYLAYSALHKQSRAGLCSLGKNRVQIWVPCSQIQGYSCFILTHMHSGEQWISLVMKSVEVLCICLTKALILVAIHPHLFSNRWPWNVNQLVGSQDNSWHLLNEFFQLSDINVRKRNNKSTHPGFNLRLGTLIHSFLAKLNNTELINQGSKKAQAAAAFSDLSHLQCAECGQDC